MLSKEWWKKYIFWILLIIFFFISLVACKIVLFEDGFAWFFLTYLVGFPLCGMALGLQYGLSDKKWRWVVPLIVFLFVLLHYLIVVDFDRHWADFVCPSVAAVSCLVAEVVTILVKRFWKSRHSKKNV